MILLAAILLVFVEKLPPRDGRTYCRDGAGNSGHRFRARSAARAAERAAAELLDRQCPPPRLLLAFMVEMALKLVAYRWAFWRSGWNVRH